MLEFGLQADWGLPVVIDLFMSGLGGCLFVATGILYFLAGSRLKKTLGLSAIVAFAAVAVGVVFLLIDVGQPLRAMWMFGSFVNFDSWMPRGAWGLTASLVVFLLFALTYYGVVEEKLGDKLGITRKILAVLGIVLGLFITTYTGFLVVGVGNIPFWNTLMLPASFICLSLTAGFATMLLLIVLVKEIEVSDVLVKRLAIVVAILGCVSLAVVAMFITNCSDETSKGYQGYLWAISNPSLYLVIAGAVLAVALSIALAVTGSKRANMVSPLVIGLVCVVVIAGVAFRYCVLGGGAHAPLLAPDTNVFLTDVFR